MFRQCCWASLLSVVLLAASAQFTFAAEPALRVGVAVADITPPLGFPMAGYYHERLAEGTIDPLLAKAIVWRGDKSAAAWVVCDLIGVSADLAQAVRRQASQKTGIPVEHIVISATHSHTAPDYSKELYLHLGGMRQDPVRAEYIEKLIQGPVAAIVRAHESAEPATIQAGAATQATHVSFNRRFVMRDGSVRTWMNFQNPEVVRSAGPIDPEIGLLAIRAPGAEAAGPGELRGLISNFALHLDTVGGSKWSADYPRYIADTLHAANRSPVPNRAEPVFLFGTGCCGDINHVDPRRAERNKPDLIGSSLGQSIQAQLPKLRTVDSPELFVKSRVVRLPLQDATRDEVARSIEILAAARRMEKVDFLEHVVAYKKLILDHLRHQPPHANSAEHITWGLTRAWAGIGDTLPAEVSVVTVGRDVAIVFLPGEVFVELGLAIKQGSPFGTTLVVELSNCVETIYIPNRGAYAGGSYEVTNSALQPGAGEMLVEAALGLLREAAGG